MSTNVLRFSLLLAIGCQGGTTAPPPDPADAQAIPSTSEALAATGATVQTGSFDQPDIAACCSGAQACSGTNPSSPYARLRLPRGPGQTVANPNEGSDGTATAWRLRQDEAVVVVGLTPPSARYYAFTPYLADRYEPTTGERKTLFASLGDSWNQLVLATASGKPFDSEFAIVFTSNATIAKSTEAALERSGVPATAINLVVLPSTLVEQGLDANADTFSFYLRIGVPANGSAAVDAWLANAPAVYRVTPNAELAVNALQPPPGRQRGSAGEDLSPAVDELGSAIQAAIGGTGTPIQTQEANPNVFDGDVCIANDFFCGGDNRDALYGSAPNTFDLDTNAYVIVYGVNHQATGKTMYSNATISWSSQELGVVAVDSTQMPGSADVFLPGNPDAPLLYAWAFARDCSLAPTPYCTEVPSEGCPLLPTGADAGITLRAYLDPMTATGPGLSEITLDRALLVPKS